MRDALSTELLRAAFGQERPRLQSVADAQQTLLAAELALFVGTSASVEGTLPNAWYLHALAMSPTVDDPQFEQRRRSAGQVAAHVFDLHLQHQRAVMSPDTRMRYLLAAQSAYHVGGVSPNAQALVESAEELPSGPGSVAMTAAHLFFGQQLTDLRSLLDDTREDYANLSPESPRFAASAVLDALGQMHSYLLSGDGQQLNAADDLLQRAIANPYSHWDVDSRWTAALLLDFGGRLRETSIWNVVDPNSRTGQALTLGSPPIYTLWPPQLDFLTSAPSPVTSAWKRAVLSLPTSAGKTLMAQILTLSYLEEADDAVCIVAPTHALCREIRSDLDTRLEVFGGRTFGWAAGSSASDGNVAVYTPEQLASFLRGDVEQLLARFGMFVFDEAHLLGDEQRGWNVEEVVSTLHHLTRDRSHRIVMVSAAMGQASLAKLWFTLDEDPIEASSQWRGPRRLHAIYTANRRRDPEWSDVPVSAASLPRRSTPVFGRISLQGPHSIRDLHFTEPVGVEVQKTTRQGLWERDGERSTNQVLRTVPLLHHLLADESAKVLAVVAQRREARDLASALAEGWAPVDRTEALAERVATRMPGSDLPGLIRRGIAYHHGLLPTDVQTDIEEATRRGDLRCIVSTTTLTEGVNLPFKAVVLVSDGFGGQANRTIIIDRPRMLNAFGRAGRACRETEGWLFYFASAQGYRDELFDKFDTDPSAFDLESTISHEDALRELADLEQLMAAGTDAVLSFTGERLSGFISYVWFVAELLRGLGQANDIGAIVAVLRDTLGWLQLDVTARSRLEQLAAASHRQYQLAEASRRARWARAGYSLPTSAAIEAIAEALAADIAFAGDIPAADDYLGWARLVLTTDRTSALVNLPENPQQLRGFKPYRSAPRDRRLDVDLAALVEDWLAGLDPADIAEGHLAGISDENERADALSEFLAGVLEHHLPWATTTLITWTNERLGVPTIPERLPWCIRFGVATGTALGLMDSGIRSRRLANRIATDLGSSESLDDLRDQVRQQTVEQWRTDFDASPSEVRDLLEFVKDPSRRPVHDVLEGRPYVAQVAWNDDFDEAANAEYPANVRPDRSSDPPKLAVVVAGDAVGLVRPEDYRDVQALLGVGVRIGLRVAADGSGGFGLGARRLTD